MVPARAEREHTMMGWGLELVQIKIGSRSDVSIDERGPGPILDWAFPRWKSR